MSLTDINSRYKSVISNLDVLINAIVVLGNRVDGVTVTYKRPHSDDLFDGYSEATPRSQSKGGIVRHPTLIMAGEVPEAIVRLSDRGNGVVADEGIGSGGDGPNLTVNVTGNTFVGSDPATADKLADIVSGRVMRQLGSFSRISLGGG